MLSKMQLDLLNHVGGLNKIGKYYVTDLYRNVLHGVCIDLVHDGFMESEGMKYILTQKGIDAVNQWKVMESNGGIKKGIKKGIKEGIKKFGCFLFTDSQYALLFKALKKWGVGFQIDMAVEECAEFIAVAKQFMRGRCGKDVVIDEITDVIIMMAQMMIIFSVEKIMERVEFKMNRLGKLIDKEEKNVK